MPKFERTVNHRDSRAGALAFDVRQQMLGIRAGGLTRPAPAAVVMLLRQWLVRQRSQVPEGSATANAIDYSWGVGPR
jgi:hypothetical protein